MKKILTTLIDTLKDPDLLSSQPHHGEEMDEETRDYLNNHGQGQELLVISGTTHTWELETPGIPSQICGFPRTSEGHLKITSIRVGNLLVTIQELKDESYDPRPAGSGNRCDARTTTGTNDN